MSATAARLLVFGSSAAVLVLEILAGRLMAPYLGVTLETFTGIIGVVLAGIAAGAWAGGRAADRVEPRALVAPVLGVAGLLVLAVPALVDAVGPSMRAGGPLEIVLLTASAFLLPSLALSTVPPIVVKARLRSLDETGSVVGSLSAVSTVGALAGTFLTGFVLLAALPTRPLVAGMGLALLAAAIALAARRLGRRGALVAVAAGIAATGGSLLARGPCDHETAYFCAVVETDPARPSGRVLWLDTLRHSYVDLEDATHLEFRYARVVADVIGTLPAGPIDAAYIGGGGFTLPRYVAAVRPGSRAEVLEIDGALVDLARAELGVEPSDALRVSIGDARLGLPAIATDALDLVVGDAFGGLSVPWHLATREFVREIDRVLAPGGLYVINLIDYPPLGFARAEVATFADVFAHVAVIAPPGYLATHSGGNFVVVGSQAPLDVPAVERAIAARRGQEIAWAGAAAARFAGEARVLRDDFAPVDQLLSRP